MKHFRDAMLASVAAATAVTAGSAFYVAVTIYYWGQSR